MSFARLQGIDRSLPIWIASALALVVLMALPIGWLASLSVSGEAGPTLAHYRRVFADAALQRALWNTIVLAFLVGLASIAVGAPLAWLWLHDRGFSDTVLGLNTSSSSFLF